MSDRSAWLDVACPRCGAEPGMRCGGWHWSRGCRARWVAECRLHVARGWWERACRKCGAWPGYSCVTPSGRETARIHAVRLRPGRGELFFAEDVWAELGRRGASIARVPFSGRGGRGGQAERIELLALDEAAGGLAEVELWSSRDELCFALEAPVWERFGTFVGHADYRRGSLDRRGACGGGRRDARRAPV